MIRKGLEQSIVGHLRTLAFPVSALFRRCGHGGREWSPVDAPGQSVLTIPFGPYLSTVFFELVAIDPIDPAEMFDRVVNRLPREFSGNDHVARGAEVLNGMAKPTTQLKANQARDCWRAFSLVLPFFVAKDALRLGFYFATYLTF
jgi:hypothetical protein